MVDVGKYAIHGSYGNAKNTSVLDLVERTYIIFTLMGVGSHVVKIQFWVVEKRSVSRSRVGGLTNYLFVLKASSPLKMVVSNRKLAFQPSIFRGYVSFREGSNYLGSIAILRRWASIRKVLKIRDEIAHEMRENFGVFLDQRKIPLLLSIILVGLWDPYNGLLQSLHNWAV